MKRLGVCFMSSDRFYGKEGIQARLTIANEAINVLEQLINLPENELLNNAINIFALKGALIIILQAILDLGNYIIAFKEMGVPSSYEDLLDILVSNRALSDDNRDKMKKLLKIRDKVLHSSETISVKNLIEISKENLSLFRDVLNIIKARIADIQKQ